MNKILNNDPINLLFTEEDGLLKYNQGVYNRYLELDELKRLKKAVDTTLDLMDSNNISNDFIKVINNYRYTLAVEKSYSINKKNYNKFKNISETNIYLIKNTRNFNLKIGYSKNPKERTCSTSNRTNVLLVFSSKKYSYY